MNSLNSIIVEGNLVREPQLKTIPNGSQVCAFALANNRFYKQNDGFEKETSFFDIEAWAKLGSTCAGNLKKGQGVRVVGRLKQDRWVDQEGQPRSKVKIVAEHVEFKREKQGDEPAAADAAKEEQPAF